MTDELGAEVRARLAEGLAAAEAEYRLELAVLAQDEVDEAVGGWLPPWG